MALLSCVYMVIHKYGFMYNQTEIYVYPEVCIYGFMYDQTEQLPIKYIMLTKRPEPL